MKTIELSKLDPKELPAYVEHMGRFYLVSRVPTEDTFLVCVSHTNVPSLQVSTSRMCNVHTEEEYSKNLQKREETLQASAQKEVSSVEGFHATSASEIQKAKEDKEKELAGAKAALASTGISLQKTSNKADSTATTKK